MAGYAGNWTRLVLGSPIHKVGRSSVLPGNRHISAQTIRHIFWVFDRQNRGVEPHDTQDTTCLLRLIRFIKNLTTQQ